MEQSEQFYTVLKANGCIVEMLRLPNSSHGGAIGGPIASRKAQNDGLLDWILPEIVNLGFCALNPIRTPPNDIYAINEQYGEKLCLIGNIDLAGSLGFGTPAEVMEDVQKHIRGLAPGGGYVVASSHDV